MYIMYSNNENVDLSQLINEIHFAHTLQIVHAQSRQSMHTSQKITKTALAGLFFCFFFAQRVSSEKGSTFKGKQILGPSSF